MKTKKVDVPPPSRRPQHVAVIMDGNGRWAQARGLERLVGHRKGADVVRDITTFARELEIRYLTLYSFSVQNWSRPPREVAGLMELLEKYCGDERDTLMKNDIRLATIGRIDRLPPSTRAALESMKAESAGNRKMVLTLAVDYGGREELVVAAQRLASDVAAGRLSADAVDEAALSMRLTTGIAGMPDPDLVIRTSGEVRVSNFLLWQIAYAELYFTDVLWPDFARRHFAEALWAYAERQRRYGGVEPLLPARARVKGS